MKLSGRKLLIINLPPPFGGGEMLNLLLFEHFCKNEEYFVIDIGKSKQKKNQQGKLSPYNIYYAIRKTIAIVYYLFRYRPSMVYFLIPKTFLAFIKTIPVILISYLLRIYSIGSLEGNSFYFLKNKNSFQGKAGAALLRRIKMIRVLGNGIAENLAKYQITNTVVVSNGVSVPSSLTVPHKIKEANDTIRFLYVGVLSEFKGISHLIHSFIALLKTIRNVELHLIGEWYSKDLQKQLEGEIEKCNLGQYFFFHGLQHAESKWKVFGQMDIYIHLSELDGQPLSILEAMGCGMPVISTKVGAIPETVVDNFNGFLLDHHSNEIAGTIETYINNPLLMAEHSANSILLFNKFYSSSKFLQRMENLFNIN